MKILQKIYWLFYRMAPRGRRAYKLKNGLDGLLASQERKTKAKLKVVRAASGQLKRKKILAFGKGKSVTKPRMSDHQIVKSVGNQHKEELAARGIRLTNKGKFKNV
ncbi:MAG: hypothetical protein AB3N16_15145 [Flavobacteriaceae bacterium]